MVIITEVLQVIFHHKILKINHNEILKYIIFLKKLTKTIHICFCLNTFFYITRILSLGLAKQGLLVRHLVMPGLVEEGKQGSCELPHLCAFGGFK